MPQVSIQASDFLEFSDQFSELIKEIGYDVEEAHPYKLTDKQREFLCEAPWMCYWRLRGIVDRQGREQLRAEISKTAQLILRWDYQDFSGVTPDKRAELEEACRLTYTLLTEVALEIVEGRKKQNGTGQKAEASGDKQASDLITLQVAVSKFYVSKVTLRRAIKNGRLRNYRDSGKPKNSAILVSESEVGTRWPRK